MSEAPPDLAVVGAGPAGLAAAWTLSEAAARVTLYERRAEPGGRLRTDVDGDARVDVAVQFLASHFDETFRLLRAAGLADRLVRAPGRDALWRGGRSHALTYGSITSMAASGALPTGLKLRLLTRYVPFLHRQRAHLDINEPERAAAAGLDEESIAAWGGREVGEDFVSLLVRPLVASYYGAAPAETSAGFYHALSAAGLEVSVYAAPAGMGGLAAGVWRALEERGVRCRAGLAVAHVAPAEAGVEVAGDWGSARHDAVVLAVPPGELEALTDLPSPVRSWLAGVRVRPTATLALHLRRRLQRDWFALAFPPTEDPGRLLAAACVVGRKAPGLTSPDADVLLLFPAPEEAEALCRSTPREALDRLLPAVERVFPELEGVLERARLYPLPEGHVLPTPGSLTHLSAFDPGWLPPRLALAGDYLVAPTVEGAVRSGNRAAARLLKKAEEAGA